MTAAASGGYRPVVLTMTNGPHDLPTPEAVGANPQDADVVLMLADDLRLRGIHRASELLAVCLAAARQARSVHVTGGQWRIRKDVAKVVATAYPALVVTWSHPKGGVLLGQRLALRSALARRPPRRSRRP